MSEWMIDRYWPIARDKPGLLTAMMRALAGEAHISFEGKLDSCPFPPGLMSSPEETAAQATDQMAPTGFPGAPP